jgi:hypothetical protein
MLKALIVDTPVVMSIVWGSTAENGFSMVIMCMRQERIQCSQPQDEICRHARNGKDTSTSQQKIHDLPMLPTLPRLTKSIDGTLDESRSVRVVWPSSSPIPSIKLVESPVIRPS